MSDYKFKTSVIERLTRLLISGQHSDIEFLLGVGDEQKKIKGHKIMFAIASPVFDAMMYGDLAEYDSITIDDIKPAAFESMMRYIYTDDIKLSSVGHAAVVFQAADKYNLPQLEKVSEEYMLANVTADVACELLEFSNLYSKTDMETTCMELIKKETSKVLESEGFLECSLKTLETIVNEEEINATDFQLFNAVEKWAIHNAERQEKTVEDMIPMLENVIKKIRFLSMMPGEFVKGPCKSKFLDFDEKFSILSNLNSPGSEPLPARFTSISLPRSAVSPQLLLSLENFYQDDKCVSVIAKWERRDISKIKFNQEYFSPVFYLNDKPFNIQYVACSYFSGDSSSLRMYLHCLCDDKIHGPNWSCSVDYSFKLLSQKEGKPDHILSSSHVFNSGCVQGWFQFIKWCELIDPERGLIKDDKLIIVATIKLNS